MSLLKRWAGPAWIKSTQNIQTFTMERARSIGEAAKYTTHVGRHGEIAAHARRHQGRTVLHGAYDGGNLGDTFASHLANSKRKRCEIVSLKKEDSAKAEESMPPVWVRKEDKAKALHEDMQRQTFSVWYFTSKIKSPAAQAKPIPGVAPAKQNNSEQTECTFQAMPKRSSQKQRTSLGLTAGQYSTGQVE